MKTNSKMKSKFNGIAACALAMVFLAAAPVLRAQEMYKTVGLPIGLVTNTVIVTNIVNSGVTNTVTNTVISANFTPTPITNSTLFVSAGGTVPAVVGRPASAIVNGWVPIPQTAQFVGFSIIITNTAAGTCVEGYDLSALGDYGTTNLPILITNTLNAGQQEYLSGQIALSSFKAAGYIRWDLLSSTNAANVQVISNRLVFYGNGY